MAVDKRALDQKVPDPGQVARLWKSPDGRWRLEKVDITGDEPLAPGMYIARHGETEWNQGGADGDSKKPAPVRPRVKKINAAPMRPPNGPPRVKPADQLYQLVLGGKFKEALAIAQQFVKAGVMRDTDVEQILDRAEAAIGRPLHAPVKPGMMPPPPPPRR